MRGVEVGSIGRGISVAPAVGRIASIAPTIGRIPSLEGGFSVKSIANPFKGVENRGYIENRRPSFLEPNIGVIRNPEAKAPPQTVSVGAGDLPSGPEAVEIAEQWLSISKPPTLEAKSIEIPIINLLRVRPILKPVDFGSTRPAVLPLYYPEPLVKPKNETKIQPKSGQIEFSKVAPRGTVLTRLNTKGVQEQPVGQNFEEEIQIKEKVEEKPAVSEREEIEEQRLKDLLDEEVAEQRVYEISEAIDLAETEANKEGVEEIDGSRILKFLRLHIGLISQIARKIRKDGSLDETLEELSARKFSSKNQAKAQTKELIAQKEPVRRGKEGKAVREGAVERVFKYHLVKRSPVEEVVLRVVKKQAKQTGNRGTVQVIAVESAGVRERTIEETGLAEVFQKTA